MGFTFKGVADSTNGVVTESITWFRKPERRAVKQLTEGKDGATVTEYGYAPLVIQAIIGITDLSKVDAIIAWLDGSGVLTCSDDPLKYRNVKVLAQVNYDRLVRYKKATVDFYVADPFRYVASEADVTKTTFPASYTNAGTVASKPLLKVTGTGTVVFVVNGITMTYVFDTAYVYIDCDSQEAYYSTTLKNRALSITGGVWPTLAVGANAITITSGTVSEIVITPRTRFV